MRHKWTAIHIMCAMHILDTARHPLATTAWQLLPALPPSPQGITDKSVTKKPIERQYFTMEEQSSHKQLRAAGLYQFKPF